MKPIIADDHKRASQLYNEKSQGHELDYYDRQFLLIYENRKTKLAKRKQAEQVKDKTVITRYARFATR